MATQNNVLLEGLRKELQNIYDSWFDDFQVLAAASRSEYMKGMTPGQPIPEEGKLYIDRYKEQFATQTEKVAQKALEVVTRELVKIQKEMTEAPTEEAARALQIFAIRAVDETIENWTERNKYADEIDGLMNAYGSNYLTYQALKKYAEKAGVHDFNEHEATKRLMVAKDAESLVNKTFDAGRVAINGLNDTDRNAFNIALMNLGQMA